MQRDVLHSSEGRGWRSIDAALIHVPRGKASPPPSAFHTIGLHVGPPVRADCMIGGNRMRRLQRPGDIDIIPAGAEGSWEDESDGQVLLLRLEPSLLERIALELNQDPATVSLAPALQLRDPRIEAIARAIKAELQADTPSDPLFVDHLGHALAVRLLELGTARTPMDYRTVPKMSARLLKHVVEYIEMNLDQKLQLSDIAAAAGLSMTQLKTLFRNSTGSTVYQYVIRRRVELARALMATTTMPASAIALAAGFAHQSHMASAMRRVLGHAPGDIDRPFLES